MEVARATSGLPAVCVLGLCKHVAPDLYFSQLVLCNLGMLFTVNLSINLTMSAAHILKGGLLSSLVSGTGQLCFRNISKTQCLSSSPVLISHVG